MVNDAQIVKDDRWCNPNNDFIVPCACNQFTPDQVLAMKVSRQRCACPSPTIVYHDLWGPRRHVCPKCLLFIQ